jgi:hypothetical protein
VRRTALFLIMDAVGLVGCWWSLPIKRANDTTGTVTKVPFVTPGNTWLSWRVSTSSAMSPTGTRSGPRLKELRIVLAVNRVDEPQFLRVGDRLAGVILVVAQDLLADGLGEVSGVHARGYR